MSALTIVRDNRPPAKGLGDGWKSSLGLALEGKSNGSCLGITNSNSNSSSSSRSSSSSNSGGGSSCTVESHDNIKELRDELIKLETRYVSSTTRRQEYSQRITSHNQTIEDMKSNIKEMTAALTRADIIQDIRKGGNGNSRYMVEDETDSSSEIYIQEGHLMNQLYTEEVQLRCEISSDMDETQTHQLLHQKALARESGRIDVQLNDIQHKEKQLKEIEKNSLDEKQRYKDTFESGCTSVIKKNIYQLRRSIQLLHKEAKTKDRMVNDAMMDIELSRKLFKKKIELEKI